MIKVESKSENEGEKENERAGESGKKFQERLEEAEIQKR